VALDGNPTDGGASPIVLGRTRPVKRRLLTREVTDTIREMILMGTLAPEGRFTQQELATALGVSTMPVREALLKLTHDGLIAATPNRSYRVVRTTRGDIEDIYWMHATLAGELAARACGRADDALVEELRVLLGSSLAGDPAAMEAANWEFHRAINLAARSPKLLLLLGTTLGFIPHGFYALIPEWAGVSERGHVRLLEAIEAHDPEAARSAAAEHVHQAAELLIQHFSETGYWTTPTPSE
jgi:DNA-binding GntR family transcriptional regulator